MILLALASSLSLAATDLSAPPPRYDSGPYTAQTVYITRPRHRCQQLNGAAVSYQPTVIIACYAPKTDTVIMPYYCDPSVYKPSSFCKALYRHELGHARGGIHINGVWMDGDWRKPPSQP